MNQPQLMKRIAVKFELWKLMVASGTWEASLIPEGTVQGPTETSPALPMEVDGGHSTEASLIPDNFDVAPLQFTAEQEALYKIRFEEGCDLFIDKKHIRWLKLNHPEFHINDSSSNENIDNPCEQPGVSRDLSKDPSTSEMVPSNLSGSNSSLSDLLVCPALNNWEFTVPKWPPAKA